MHVVPKENGVDFEVVSCCCGFVVNLVLAQIVWTKSRKEMSRYKYLLFSFCLYDAFYSLVHFLVRPVMLNYRAAATLFATGPLAPFFGRELIAFYTSIHSIGITLLAFHFIYRFLTIRNPSHLIFFVHPMGIAGITAAIVGCAVAWLFNNYYLLAPTEETNEYVREVFLATHGVNPDEMVYLANVPWLPNTSGDMTLQWKPLVAIYGITLIIIQIAYGIIGYCALQIFYFLREFTTSLHTHTLQRQLFKTLLIQTLFPTTLMIMPMVIVNVMPLFRTDWQFWSKVSMSLISFFPLADAFSITYCIAEYRAVVVGWCAPCLRSRVTQHDPEAVVHCKGAKSDSKKRQSRYESTTPPV